MHRDPRPPARGWLSPLLPSSILRRHPSPTPLIFPPFAHSHGIGRVTGLRLYLIVETKRPSQKLWSCFSTSLVKRGRISACLSAKATFKRNAPTPPAPPWFHSVDIPYTGRQSGFLPLLHVRGVWCHVRIKNDLLAFLHLRAWWGLLLNLQNMLQPSGVKLCIHKFRDPLLFLQFLP